MPEPSKDALRDVAGVLADALKALDAAGKTDEACTLAARAWSHLKAEHPREAEKMNGLLHLFTRTGHRR